MIVKHRKVQGDNCVPGGKLVEKREAVMTLLSYRSAETSQALPSWEVRGGCVSTPTFRARAFFLHFGGEERGCREAAACLDGAKDRQEESLE